MVDFCTKKKIIYHLVQCNLLNDTSLKPISLFATIFEEKNYSSLRFFFFFGFSFCQCSHIHRGTDLL